MNQLIHQRFDRTYVTSDIIHSQPESSTHFGMDGKPIKKVIWTTLALKEILEPPQNKTWVLLFGFLDGNLQAARGPISDFLLDRAGLKKIVVFQAPKPLKFFSLGLRAMCKSVQTESAKIFGHKNTNMSKKNIHHFCS